MSLYEVVLHANWWRSDTENYEWRNYSSDIGEVLYNLGGFNLIALDGGPDPDELADYLEEGGGKSYFFGTYRGTFTVSKEVYATSQRDAIRTARDALENIMDSDGREDDSLVGWCRGPEWELVR